MRTATSIVLAFTGLLLFSAVGSSPLKSGIATSPFELVSIVHLEEPCVRQGGICLRKEDCEPGNLVQVRGVLCPAQLHQGVECCYS